MDAATANILHGNKEYTPMHQTEWESCWRDGKAFFHSDKPHPLLMKHSSSMINGREGIRIFVPLCGKSVDMKCFYDQGHTVVGVDLATQPLEEFFKDQDLECVTSSLNNGGKLLQTPDGRLRLYCMDLMEFGPSLEGGFQGAWDRGALSAINMESRERYVSVILSVMAADARYFLDVSVFDPTEYQGPPYPIDEDEVSRLLGSSFSYEILESLDYTTHYTHFRTSKLIKYLYLLKFK